MRSHWGFIIDTGQRECQWYTETGPRAGELVVSSSPCSVPETAIKPFVLKSHFERWLIVTLRDRQVDTSWYKLTLSWHGTPSRQRVVALAPTHYVNLISLFKTPIGNLLLTNFKSSEVWHYTVLTWNRTLKSRCFPALPVQAMLSQRNFIRKSSLSFDPLLNILDWESRLVACYNIMLYNTVI